MEIHVFLLAFLGGLVGAVLMDVTETWAARVGISSGVTVALVGRWFLFLLKGQVRHANILTSPVQPREIKAGWIFHFLIGGGAVALLYPLFFMLAGRPLPAEPLLGGVVFGLATSLLPWFILLPSFGWGLFGRRGPKGANALLASTLSHVPYGLGIGLVMTLAAP
jgi:hypothetical protein